MLARLVLLLLVATSTRALAQECKTAAEQMKCKAACDAKRFDLCAKLGLAILNEGDPSRVADGVALVQKACDGKSALGCGGLGSLHMGGIGVSRDAARAVKLFEGACAKGDALSCESLGGWYGQGGDPATPMDLTAALPQAAHWYEKACTLNRPAPCAFLGAFIMDGSLPKADRKRVPGLFDKACRGKVEIACKMLGDLYAKGELVKRDVKRANALYAQACKMGYDRACAAKAE